MDTPLPVAAANIRYWLSNDPHALRISWTAAGGDECALAHYTPGIDDHVAYESTGAVIDEVPDEVHDVALAAFRYVFDGHRQPRGYQGDETTGEAFERWCAVGDALATEAA